MPARGWSAQERGASVEWRHPGGASAAAPRAGLPALPGSSSDAVEVRFVHYTHFGLLLARARHVNLRCWGVPWKMRVARTWQEAPRSQPCPPDQGRTPPSSPRTHSRLLRAVPTAPRRLYSWAREPPRRDAARQANRHSWAAFMLHWAATGQGEGGGGALAGAGARVFRDGRGPCFPPCSSVS